MNIFFTGSIRGGRAMLPLYEIIVRELQKYGQVLSAHVADQNITVYGETDLSKEEIYDREMESIKNSDVLIAEVTTPSLGVGFEIAQALNKAKRVICLYQGGNTYKLSAMIKGDPRVEVLTYSTKEELVDLVEKIFKK